MDPLQRLYRLEDFEAARGLLHAYATVLDEPDVATVTALFDPDATLTNPRGTFRKRDAIAADYAVELRRVEPVHQHPGGAVGSQLEQVGGGHRADRVALAAGRAGKHVRSVGQVVILMAMERSATAEGILRNIDPGSGRSLRSDAQRNRDLVIRAALEIFASYGAMGTVEQIAARAGVGRATVYRSFPTREALQIAVATSQFEQIARIALDAVKESAEPGVGLVEFVFGAFEYNQANRLYLELFDGRPTPEMLDVHTASRGTIAALTDEARAAGVVRSDVTENDVAVFVGGVSTRLAAEPASAPADWRRMARHLLAGLGVPDRLLPPTRTPRAHAS